MFNDSVCTSKEAKVGKLKVVAPVARRVIDLTSPNVVKVIWDEADRVTRQEAPIIRRRSERASRSSSSAATA